MHWLTLVFVVAVIGSTAVELWLSQRQVATVTAHRDRVPEPFADTVSAEDHRKAADYTIAKARFGRLSEIVNALVTLGLTVGGGIAIIDGLWRRTDWTQPWLGTAVIATVFCVTGIIGLPLSLWSTFRLEARFGFNRTTVALFLADLGKGLLLAVLLGGPLLLATLTLMERAGRLWWVWAWFLWLAMMFFMTWAFPAFIAPLFNKFSPLEDEILRSRIEALLTRCGFASKGVFVVDNSRRSSHECVFHRDRPAQAHRVLRHAARAPGAPRGGSGSRARARALPAQARPQAAAGVHRHDFRRTRVARLARQPARVLRSARGATAVDTCGVAAVHTRRTGVYFLCSYSPHRRLLSSPHRSARYGRDVTSSKPMASRPNMRVPSSSPLRW